jgi:hypothetical protein
MTSARRILVAGCAVGLALSISPVEAADSPGARPGDDAMTCEAIATELAPYAQQMMPNIQAMANSQSQLYGQARQKYDERMLEHQAMAPLATAGALDPTGASKRAYAAAEMAQSAKERGEDEAFANSPLALQNKAQSEQVMAQGQQMQGNARLQRLMQLAQQKHCDKRM